VARDEVHEAQGPKSHPAEGSVLALQAVDLVGDADLGGAKGTVWSVPKPTLMAPGVEKFVVDLGDDSPDRTPPATPHGKGPAVPEATSANDLDARSCGEYPLVWHDLDHPEAEPTFILDDPTELNLW
jgi:hypothetical protein